MAGFSTPTTPSGTWGGFAPGAQDGGGNWGDLPATSSDSSKKVGTPRTIAFSPNECLAITRAMIRAKQDPVKGSGQKSDDFHQTFQLCYNKLMDSDWPHRSTSSLVSKYADIKRDSAKFSSRMMLAKVLQVALLFVICGFRLWFLVFVVFTSSQSIAERTDGEWPNSRRGL